MSNIIKSVSTAFAKTRDARIDYHVVEKGSASLITGIYDQTDPASLGFYRKPDVTQGGTSAKLAVIYGEVMITPYIVDAGVESSTNDAGSILKTYRFITGEGTNSGIVVGPNGSPLENIYIKDPNGVPQPVIDSNGRPSLGNVVLASILGGAITSLPKIWDIIKGSSTTKTTTVDPITGKPILSPDEKAAQKLADKISLGELIDVNDSSKNNNYVLVFDSVSNKWIAKPINVALSEAGGSTTVTVGTDGSITITGGSPIGSVPSTNTCYPVANFIERPIIAPPMRTKNGMILLPTLLNTTHNEYTQSINVLGTKGLELHFYTSGCASKAIWSVAAGDIPPCPSSPELACFVDTNKVVVEKPATPGQTVTYFEPSFFQIKICMTTNVCGSEYLIYSTVFSESAFSKTGYTVAAPVIYWTDTDLRTLLEKYPGQVFNAGNTDIKLHISRVDSLGSQYDVYFEGYKKFFGEYSNTIAPTLTIPTTNQLHPLPVAVKADDGKFPDNIPGGGGMGPPTCHTLTVLPSTPGSVVVTPSKAIPTIELSSPCARQYGTQTFPPVFDEISLPSVIINSSITDPICELFYEIVVGLGSISTADPLPNGVVGTPGSGTYYLIGTQSDLMIASQALVLTPDPSSKGDIHYTVVVTNSEGSAAGEACLLVPSQITVTESQGAVAKLCVENATTGGTGKVMITFNGKTRDLTTGYVDFVGTPTDTAAAIASNINATVAFANAYDPADTNWLPLFVATSSAEVITVTAPAAGGSDFNGMTLSTAVTGSFVFGDCIGTFLGGVTKTITDFLYTNPKWRELGDILYNIAGNVIGAVALNMLMGDVGQEQLTLPADANVDVSFLYRGRVIEVPNEYDAFARTGHPVNYAAFSGTWKQQWTTNPAWIVWDFINNKKYGLGQELSLSTAQRNALLEDIFLIGHYCDEIVTTTTSLGAKTGPRFSTNTVITDGTKLQILQQLCSVFYGAVVFYNGGLRVGFDRLNTNIKLLVNQSNAGNFDKSLTSSKNFTNKVRLSYIEPANFYTEEIVVAEDLDSIAKYGEKISDVISFGVTNEAQAIRHATWILNSEKENSVIVSYSAGIDHYNLLPGDIVEFYDSNERGIRRAGRIVSQSGTSVVLDAPIASVIGDHFSLSLLDGTIHQTTIAAISGVNVTLTVAPPSTSYPNATFIAANVSQGPRYYKVIKVDEVSNSKFNITLQFYTTDKY